jgi:uncharacterized membrane protein YdjX (TVP38/TMEM64 family)
MLLNGKGGLSVFGHVLAPSCGRWLLAALVLLTLLLVPFVAFGAGIEAALLAALDIVGQHRLAAYTTIVAMLVVDVLLPVPSSVVSATAGALFGFWGGLTAIWLGMSLGSLVGYGIGRAAGPALRRVVGPEDLERARGLLDRRGAVVLVLARGVPVLAEATVLVAGAARMRLGLFLAMTLSANLAVALAYAAVGALALSAGSFFLFFFGLATVPALSWLLFDRIAR